MINILINKINMPFLHILEQKGECDIYNCWLGFPCKQNEKTALWNLKKQKHGKTRISKAQKDATSAKTNFFHRIDAASPELHRANSARLMLVMVFYMMVMHPSSNGGKTGNGLPQHATSSPCMAAQPVTKMDELLKSTCNSNYLNST